MKKQILILTTIISLYCNSIYSAEEVKLDNEYESSQSESESESEQEDFYSLDKILEQRNLILEQIYENMKQKFEERPNVKDDPYDMEDKWSDEDYQAQEDYRKSLHNSYENIDIFFNARKTILETFNDISDLKFVERRTGNLSKGAIVITDLIKLIEKIEKYYNEFNPIILNVNDIIKKDNKEKLKKPSIELLNYIEYQIFKPEFKKLGFCMPKFSKVLSGKLDEYGLKIIYALETYIRRLIYHIIYLVHELELSDIIKNSSNYESLFKEFLKPIPDYSQLKFIERTTGRLDRDGLKVMQSIIENLILICETYAEINHSKISDEKRIAIQSRFSDQIYNDLKEFEFPRIHADLISEYLV